MKFPFEVPFDQVQASPDEYVSVVFSCLESDFLVLPKGDGFVEYPIFETGYEALKQATEGFTNITSTAMLRVALEVPISIVVIRTMLGFTPPEWAYLATQRTGVEVSQGFVRTLDRKIRMSPLKPLGKVGVTAERVQALIETACQLLSEGAPQEDDGTARDKVTRVQHLAELSIIGQPSDQPKFEVIACIAGRGFKVRREDMKKLIYATRGKVFTLKTLDRLVECSRLKAFKSK